MDAFNAQFYELNQYPAAPNVMPPCYGSQQEHGDLPATYPHPGPFPHPHPPQFDLPGDWMPFHGYGQPEYPDFGGIDAPEDEFPFPFEGLATPPPQEEQEGHTADFSDSTILAEPQESSPAPETGASSPKSKLPVANPAYHGLRFARAEEAMAFIEKRGLVLSEDDYEAMEANPFPHVLRIIAAFNAVPCSSQGVQTTKVLDPEAWSQYQQTHITKVAELDKEGATRELGAWYLFNTLIDVHKNGPKNPSDSLKGKITKQCSAHLDQIVKALGDYTIIRYDVARYYKVDDLVNNTHEYITRKINNFKGNHHKKSRDRENAKLADEAGIEYKAVLGSKRKAGDGEKKERAKRVRESVKAGADDE